MTIPCRWMRAASSGARSSGGGRGRVSGSASLLPDEGRGALREEDRAGREDRGAVREDEGVGGSGVRPRERVGHHDEDALTPDEGLEQGAEDYKTTGTKGKKSKGKGKQKQEKDVKSGKAKSMRREDDPDSPSGGAVQQPLGRYLG